MLLDKFLTTSRMRPSTVSETRSSDVESLSDSARIVTSTAFRRLQTKAQVFSLEQNAAVRSRLTHSLEVATYGKWISHDAFQKLREKNQISSDKYLQFITTVENACLLHDVGNPPFGHLGEFAIQQWLRNNKVAIAERVGVHEVEEFSRYYDSLSSFDGNPQGFRFVTSSHPKTLVIRPYDTNARHMSSRSSLFWTDIGDSMSRILSC